MVQQRARIKNNFPPEWLIPEYDLPGMGCFRLEVVERFLLESEQDFGQLWADGADSNQASELASKYLCAVDAILYEQGFTDQPSLILHQLLQMLELGRQGKPHPLMNPEIPVRNRRSLARSRIEAEAAVVLECVVYHDCSQVQWLGFIRDALKRAGFWRPSTPQTPSGPYSTDAIRNWHRACGNSRHPASSHYRSLLECYSSDVYCPEAALGRLKYLLAKGYW